MKDIIYKITAFIMTLLCVFFDFSLPYFDAKRIAEAYDPVADGVSSGTDLFHQYHPDNIKNTLSNKCVTYDADGNCTQYLLDENHGYGSLVPGSDTIKGGMGSYSGISQQELEAMQAQGGASSEYADFTQGMAKNKCIEYEPCPIACTDFQNGYCHPPSSYSTGEPPQGAVALGTGYENFRQNVEGNNTTMTCYYDTYQWYQYTDQNNVTTYYKKFDKTIDEARTCSKTDFKDDLVFSNKCFQRDANGKCTVWSSSKDIMLNSYADCTKTTTPIYQDPGTVQTCQGDIKNMNKNEVKDPCNVRNTAQVSNSVGFTECSQVSMTPSDGQIYSTCKNYWLWYKVYDRTVSPAQCPMQCSSVPGTYCTTPPTYQITPYPNGSTFLGVSYENFMQTSQQGGVTCRYDGYNWYLNTGVYYKNFNTTTQYSISCPTQCSDVGGGLCSDYPATYSTSMPSGGTLVGESYEEFSGCSYKVYKWYKVFHHSDIETVKLNRTSNCDSGNLDEWLDKCWVKQYEICNPDGSGCVTVVNDGQPAATFADCKTAGGVEHNYNICPNDGGAMVVNDADYTTTGMTIDDGSGAHAVEKSPVTETVTMFGNTVDSVKTYGGSTVKASLNDWYANVTFACDTYLNVPPECQGLVDQGCKLRDFTCIDPPQTDPAHVPDCKVYEYNYQCGSANKKVIGYDVKYECSNSVIEGLQCMGTTCGADASYEANQDFMAFATAQEIMKQIQIDTDKIDVNNIKIFPGEKRECQSWPKNCCKSLSGAMGIVAYIKLGFVLPKIYQIISGGFSAFWTGALVTNATILSSLGIGQVVTITTDIANLYLASPGTQILQIQTLNLNGTVTAIAADSTAVTAATIMSAISIGLMIYSIVTIIYDLLFACSKEDVQTGVQVGQNRCHYVKTRCSSRILGICIKKKKVYCCFNSLLARLIQEQGRPQIGKAWDETCAGFTPAELSQLDFASMDLSEYMQYLEGEFKDKVTPEEQTSMGDTAQQGIPSRQQDITNRMNQYYQPK